MVKVKLNTNFGEIIIELYKDMPKTSANFVKLVKEGFYDGIIFHRIIKNFMIQGGDPTGTGIGGPGYNIRDEFTNPPKQNKKGTISMANAGPNTGGSQFFLNVADNVYLDKKHPAFGEIIDGMKIVEEISNLPVDYRDKPKKEVKIIKAEVVEE